MLKPRINILERIERSRMAHIRRIDYNHVFNPILRYEIENGLNHVSVGINKAEPVAITNVLAHQKFK